MNVLLKMTVGKFYIGRKCIEGELDVICFLKMNAFLLYWRKQGMFTF